MTILQKITLPVLAVSSGLSLCAAPELSQLAGALSEILVSLVGKTGAEILTTKESAISQAFAIDTTSGSEIIAAVEKAIVELEEALIRSNTVKFSDKTDQNIKTRNSIFNYAGISKGAIKDAKLSKEIAAIQNNIKLLFTTTDSPKKLTSLGRTALKNLPTQLAQYKEITDTQTERRRQLKQLYETATTNKNTTTKTQAKNALTSLAAEYAPLEGIVNSLGDLITSIKDGLKSFTNSTTSSHIEDILIKQLTEIANLPIHQFTKEFLNSKIADKATLSADKSTYKKYLQDIESAEALLRDVQQAIIAEKNELADKGAKINATYTLVVDMRDKITKNDPNAQQYMNESKFKLVHGPIKNIFSETLKKMTGKEIFKGTKDLEAAIAIKAIPDSMLTLAGAQLEDLTTTLESDLDHLIEQQEKFAPADGLGSRATFDKIKEIRLELKKQKLSGTERKRYVEENGKELSKDIQQALAGESEWD